MPPHEHCLPCGHPDCSEAEIDAVARVLRSGRVGMGPETLACERELAAIVEAPQVVTVNSRTSALFLALRVQPRTLTERHESAPD